MNHLNKSELCEAIQSSVGMRSAAGGCQKMLYDGLLTVKYRVLEPTEPDSV